MTLLEQAKDPNTPPEVLVDIIGDVRCETGVSEEAFFACRNPNLPTSAMENVARNGIEGLRLDLCGNPNLTATTFELLRQDKQMWCNLTLNPSVPVWFLVAAARSYIVGARANAARNPNTPTSILMELVRDPDGYVRGCLLQNPEVPNVILWILATDCCDTNRVNAYYSRKASPQLRLQMACMEQSKFARSWMAKCVYTPPAVKMWLQGGYGELSLEEFLEASGVNL